MGYLSPPQLPVFLLKQTIGQVAQDIKHLFVELAVMMVYTMFWLASPVSLRR